jgi:hypothetical protein
VGKLGRVVGVEMATVSVSPEPLHEADAISLGHLDHIAERAEIDSADPN